MLVIFSGLPGTGKTTIARALAVKMKAAFLWIDSLEQALVNSGLIKTGDDLGPAGYMAAQALAADNLRLGLSVITDPVNPFAITRDTWRDVALECGVKYDEFANLPGKYAPPEGGLFLAHYDGKAVGCVGLRKFDGTICEVKRLYVSPEYRGLKIGFALVEKVMLAGKDAGYDTMVLDTLASLDKSLSLYYRMGFKEIPPYYHNPYPGVVYLQKKLQE